MQHPKWVNAAVAGGIGLIIAFVIGVGVVLMVSGGDGDGRVETDRPGTTLSP